MIKSVACFYDIDIRDELWPIGPGQREAFWGPGERVLCDDARLVELAGEEDLFKFVKNSWIPATGACMQSACSLSFRN